MKKRGTRATRIFALEKGEKMELPLYTEGVPAGFPSPADDFTEYKLDLNEFLIKHPASTYFVRVVGDSMEGAGIHSDDLLIVDRSVEPTSGRIVIAMIDGEFTVKRLRRIDGRLYLAPENPEYEAIEMSDGMELTIWGVVTNVIHPV